MNCIICGARVRNLNPRANTCGPVCTEAKKIKEGAPTVKCDTCGEPTLVRYGLTTGLNCAGCELALGASEEGLREEGF